MLQNYVINLSSALKRREHIIQEFGKHNIPFQFFDALMPSEELEQIIQTELPHLAQAALSDGEKACFMSHYVLWKKCLDENLPYICIFEDDVLLGNNADLFLSEYDWLTSRIQNNEAFILKLETFLKPVKTSLSSIPNYQNRQLLELHQVHYGTAGYIISQEMIKLLFDLFSKLSANELDAIDIMIFDRILNQSDKKIYQLSPAICIQELQFYKKKSQLSSDIQAERKILQDKQKNKIKKKVTFKEKLVKILTKYQRWKKKRDELKNIILYK